MDPLDIAAAVKPTLPPVLLIGNRRPSLPAVRSLGPRGIPVFAATRERGVASASRYLRGFFSTPNPVEEPEAFRMRLCEIGRTFPEPPVLIPCDDVTVDVAARGWRELGELFRLVGPAPEVALQVLDKRSQYARAAEFGIPMPPTWLPQGPEDAERIAAEARFPLVVKPATAQQFLVTYGFKAMIVSSVPELTALLHRYRGMVVQEMVPGDIETLYEHNSFVDRSGHVVISTVARKRDEDPKPFGSATAIEMVEHPELEELGLSVVRGFGFRGSSHSEFKYDARVGEFKFIEFNPRFAWSAMVQVAAGVDTIHAAYAEAAGLVYDPVPAKLQRTVWFIPERITKGKAILPPRRLPGSIAGRTRYVTDLFDPRDPSDLGPLWLEIRNGLRRRLVKFGRGIQGISRHRRNKDPEMAGKRETEDRSAQPPEVSHSAASGVNAR